MASLWGLRYALRRLGSNKLLVISTCLILAFGMSVILAAGELMARTVFQKLPYADSDSLRILRWDRGGRMSDSLTNAQALFWAGHGGDLYEQVAIYGPLDGCALLSAKTARYVQTVPVSPEFFSVLGARAEAGHLFRPGDSFSADATPIVISYALWSAQFASRQDLLSSTIHCGSRTYRVVGVLAKAFNYFPYPDLWVEMDLQPDYASLGRNYKLLARAKRGMASAQRGAMIANLNRVFAQENPQQVTVLDRGVVEMPLSTWLVRSQRSTIQLLITASLLLAVLILSNVVSLQLIRMWGMRRSFAIQVELGAPPSRMVCQLLWDSAILGIAATTSTILIAPAIYRLMVSAGGTALTATIQPLSASQRVVLEMTAGLFSIGILAGSALSAALSRQLLSTPSRTLEGSTAGPNRRDASSRVLVSLQLALSLSVLAGGAALATSLTKLTGKPLGVDPQGLASVDLNLDAHSFPTSDSVQLFAETILGDVRGHQHDGAFATSGPFEPGLNVLPPVIAGKVCDPVAIQYRGVSEDYFKALAMPTLGGVLFRPNDFHGNSEVAVVNLAFLSHCHMGISEIGSVLSLKEDFPRLLVGVTGDVLSYSAMQSPDPTIYVPLNQVPAALLALNNQYYSPVLIVRQGKTRGVVSLEGIVQRANPSVPVLSNKSIQERFASVVSSQVGLSVLMEFTAVVAFFVTLTGCYGLVKAKAALREREMAIRIALGAGRWDIFRQTARDLGFILTVGTVLGCICGALLCRWLVTSQLWVSRPPDRLLALLLAGMAVFMVITSFIPTVLAFKSSTLQSLRE